MSNASEIVTSKYYQVSITFHAAADVEFYYLVEATSIEEAEKQAVNRASEDLYVKEVLPAGNGAYEVVINYKRFKNGNKYYTVSAATEEEAGKLAINEAKKSFTPFVIFTEEIDTPEQ